MRSCFVERLLNIIRLREKSLIPERDIELIVYDFDGVMTDNAVLVREDGRESVRANRSDGLGINIIREKGIQQLILSTERNQVVSARAHKVELPVIQGVQNKQLALEAYCNQHGFDPQRTLYVGNDTNDMEVMKYVGVSAAPVDAHPSILRIATVVLKKRGGDGVIRELADRLSSKGR